MPTVSMMADPGSTAALRPGPLADVMQDRADRMFSAFERIRRRHRGERGRRREDDVRDFLRAFLPSRFGVDTGEIVATDGTVSPQVDIIVWDALETPLLDSSESSIQVPIEGVYGVIEVASRLDSAKLARDAAKIRAVKQMPKRAYFQRTGLVVPVSTVWGRQHAHFPVLGFCFAYDSVGLRFLERKLVQIDDVDPSLNVDMICSLTRGNIANGIPTTTPRGAPDVRELAAFPTPQNVRCRLVGDDTGLNLMLFYLIACGTLVQGRTDPVRMAEYMHAP